MARHSDTLKKIQIGTKILFLVQGFTLMVQALFPCIVKICDCKNELDGIRLEHESWLMLAFGGIQTIGGFISFFKDCLYKSGPRNAFICFVLFSVIPSGLVIHRAFRMTEMFKKQPHNMLEDGSNYALPLMWAILAVYMLLIIGQFITHTMISCSLKPKRNIPNEDEDVLVNVVPQLR